MESESIVKQALKDSEAYFKKLYPNNSPTSPVVNFKVEDGLKMLAVACEICTLKWVLGNGKLNCYEGVEDDKR